MALTFRGGIHPDDNKKATASKPVETPTPPTKIIIPMSMHAGAECVPLVKVGDHVDVGQKIGDSNAPISAPVHSSVSGTVLEVSPQVHPNGMRVISVIIENDYADTLCPTIKPRTDAEIKKLSSSDLIDIIREAGIVGLGGAAFPTHFKIKTSVGKVDTLIINCSECEPYITSGYRGMLDNTDAIIKGIGIVMRAIKLDSAIIGIEANKHDVVPVLEDKIKELNLPITVKILKTKYPQGGEKQLVYAITKKEIAPGQLPASVGCAVFNPDTCAAIYNALSNGLPIISRVVTVVGSAIANPKNLNVRVGAQLSTLFAAVGGFLEPPHKLIHGGPMMGTALYSEETPVIKATNAVLAFSKNEEAMEKEPTCIRCGRCVSACPMNLMPVYIAMYYDKEDFEALDGLNVMDCIECGSCSYICPGRLHLTHTCRSAKIRVQDYKKKQAELSSGPKAAEGKKPDGKDRKNEKRGSKK